jgi:hypothetical protein
MLRAISDEHILLSLSKNVTSRECVTTHWTLSECRILNNGMPANGRPLVLTFPRVRGNRDSQVGGGGGVEEWEDWEEWEDTQERIATLTLALLSAAIETRRRHASRRVARAPAN